MILAIAKGRGPGPDIASLDTPERPAHLPGGAGRLFVVAIPWAAGRRPLRRGGRCRRPRGRSISVSGECGSPPVYQPGHRRSTWLLPVVAASNRARGAWRGRVDAFRDQLVDWRTRAALMPPNPKELERAVVGRCSRPCSGT